jgi:hypothetical protein
MNAMMEPWHQVWAKGLLINLICELETVYVCLDALDECSTPNKMDILEVIFTLLGRYSNVKFLISSRSGDTTIEDYIGEVPVLLYLGVI